MHNSEMKHRIGRIDIGVLLKDVMVEVGTQVPSEKRMGGGQFCISCTISPLHGHI